MSGEIFKYNSITNLLLSLAVKFFLKIGKHLAMLRTGVRFLVFLLSVYKFIMQFGGERIFKTGEYLAKLQAKW